MGEGPQDVNVDIEQRIGEVRGGKVVGLEIREFYGEIIVRPESIEELPPAPGEPPYKGLAYYTEADAEIFFGRQKLSDHLVARLRKERFLALVGASGSGKSSVLRAGAVPRLQARNWQIHLVKPGAEPLVALANTLTQEELDPAVTDALVESLATRRDTLLKVGDKLAARHNAEGLLLAVDQFEETFTQCKDPDTRNAFVANLVAVAQAQGATTVVICIRADFYDRVSEFAALTDLVSQQQAYVTRMAPEELVRVIAEPAKRGGWQFVEGLVEQFVEDVGREPGRLPLLSHALLETWKRRRGVVMTLGGYREAGGVEGAIAQTAEQTLNRLIEQAAGFEEVTREIFLGLTALGEGSEDTRRVAGREELSIGVADEAVDSVLEELIAARLVTVREDEVEVAHEALIRRWPRLQEWLEDNRERLRFERQVAHDAQEWERLDRDRGALYRGARLARAVEWLQEDRAGERLGSRAKAFLEASRDLVEREAREREARRQRELEQERALAAEQRQRADAEALSARRLRLMLAVAGALIVVLVAISVVLVRPVLLEWQAKREARSEVVEIEGGRTIIGTNETDAEPSEKPEWSVDLSTFHIEKYEVSNRQYLLCVEFGDCTATSPSDDLYDASKREHPVVDVTAIEAATYCNWLGRRLPSNEEWERAARGLTGRDWPWEDGSPPTDAHGNVGGDDTQPVTSYPSGMTPERVYNLWGNVWEWTSSYMEPYGDGYDHNSTWNGKPESIDQDTALVLRGNGVDGDVSLRITYRFNALPHNSGEDIGLRCVQDSG